MNKKPTILMIPSWYPTKENPISGCFFKEQAEILSDRYNFVIVHLSANPINVLKFIIYKVINKKLISLKIDNSYPLLPEFFLSFRCLELNNLVLRIFQKLHLKTFDSLEKMLNTKIKQNALNLLSTSISTKPDLVYAMTAQVIAVEAQEVATFFNIPYILAEHCPFPLPGTILSQQIRLAIENADAILSISHDKTRQMLMQNLKINTNYVGNLINENQFKIAPINTTKHNCNILIVAANNFYKDYQTFFMTIQLLKKITQQEFSVTIVGFCPIQSINEWSKGEADFFDQLKKFNILDICTCIPKVNRDGMPEYYHNADVFVMTSIQEGLPVSSLEAACCGLPVFATRCGGVEDFIDDKCGRLFNLQDYKSIAYVLKDFIEGKISFDSEYIRQNVISKYGVEAFRQNVYSIFDNVIDNYAKNNKFNS